MPFTLFAGAFWRNCLQGHSARRTAPPAGMEGAFIACSELALWKTFGLASIDAGQQGQGPMIRRLGCGGWPGSEIRSLARLLARL